MKYVSNTTKNTITYKDKSIPPGASVMLNNKGEVVDEITDNTEEIEKLRGAISNTVTLAQVDERLEEVECRITHLVTCTNSEKKIDGFSVDFTKILDPSTLLSCAISDKECYYVRECLPASEYVKGLEPGIYLGDLSQKVTSELWSSVCTYEDDRCRLCGNISLILRSCLVIPSTCSYGCVQGQYRSTPAFIFQISEDNIKKAYICNIVGFEKRCFYFRSPNGYTDCPSTYGIDNCRLCNVYCRGSFTYCVCDWNNNVLMSLKDYLSSCIPTFYEEANKKIVTTSATRLQ